MENIYTLNEAKAYLKISDSTIRRYIRSGKLKVQKLGREYRITETVLKEFFESQQPKEEGEE